MQPRRFMHRLGSGVVYSGYLAVALIAIMYAFHFFHVRDLRDRRRPRQGLGALPIELSLARKVGIFENQQLSSFLHFEREKPSGEIRIGCLGDSFTRGNEVGLEQDYPTLLQKRFERSGFANVRVLNFGSSYHGFHQSTFIWEELARHYDLDYVLMGPAGFQPKRDTRFNHSNGDYPYYLHARYILTPDDVELVEVLGDDRDDRFENYYRFIPHRRYLRYGRELPAFLAALVPGGRTMQNPFYYSTLGVDEEAYESYERLLTKMTRSGAQFVIAHYEKPIVELAMRVGRDNLTVAHLERRMKFPYLAPQSHDAPMGNLFVAESFFRILTHDDAAQKVVETSDVLKEAERPSNARALHSYERVYVAMENGPEGYFVGTNNTSPSHLMEQQVVSLLGFRFGEESVLDAFFLPLSIPLDIAAINASGFDVRQIAPNIGVITLGNGRRKSSRPWSVIVRVEDVARLSKLAQMLGTDFEVEKRDGQNFRRLLPDGSDWIRLGADEIRLLDPQQVEGQIQLVLESEEMTERIPIAHWRWIDQSPPNARVPHPACCQLSLDQTESWSKRGF